MNIDHILNSLQQASFKGAIFLIDGAEYDGGRKTVSHEYPNQDTRYVEDLGLMPPKFELTGIISGENYFSDRDALIAALEEGGAGALIHPWYGEVTVTATTFRIKERIKELGIAEFRMKFEVSSALPQPSLLQDNLPKIGELSDQLNRSILDDFENFYAQLYKYQENFLAAQAKMTSLLTTLNRLTNGDIGYLDNLNEFNSEIRDSLGNLTGNIGDAVTLGQQTQSTLNSFSQVSSTPQGSLTLNAQLFGFGNDDIIPTNNTSYLAAERTQNNYSINSLANLTALSNAYVNASLIDYQEESQINTVQETLETQYQEVINSPTISNDTLSILQELRFNVTILLESNSLSIVRLIEIETQSIPLTVLAYNYYESVDNVPALAKVNQLYNPAMTSGKILIYAGQQ